MSEYEPLVEHPKVSNKLMATHAQGNVISDNQMFEAITDVFASRYGSQWPEAEYTLLRDEWQRYVARVGYYRVLGNARPYETSWIDLLDNKTDPEDYPQVDESYDFEKHPDGSYVTIDRYSDKEVTLDQFKKRAILQKLLIGHLSGRKAETDTCYIPLPWPKI